MKKIDTEKITSKASSIAALPFMYGLFFDRRNFIFYFIIIMACLFAIGITCGIIEKIQEKIQEKKER